MSTPMNVMSPADRRAAELYLKDLQADFKENTTMLLTAKDLGDTDGRKAYSDKNAALYREITEVQVALGRAS